MKRNVVEKLDWIIFRTDLYFVFQRDAKFGNNLKNTLYTTNMYEKAMCDSTAYNKREERNSWKYLENIINMNKNNKIRKCTKH